jgi:transposase
VQQQRREHQEATQRINAGRLIYVDESAATTAMTRTQARAPRGERAVGVVPAKHWSVITMVSAIGLTGILASLIYEGATDEDAFATFVEEVLGPQLCSGDVVLMDNLAAHKSDRVRAAIESRGATQVFLPPYSPDFNPIERAWSKVKAWLRKRAARTKLTLSYAIGEALDRITALDCYGYFKACGIPVGATANC